MEYVIAIICVVMVVAFVQVTMWKDEGKMWLN